MARQDKKIRPFIDIYTGLGIRYHEATYETYSGYVKEIYYSYKKDNFSSIRSSAHLGLKIGVLPACEGAAK